MITQASVESLVKITRKIKIFWPKFALGQVKNCVSIINIEIHPVNTS